MLKEISEMLYYKLGGDINKLIEPKEFLKVNKELLLKEKIETKEITFQVFENCFESKSLENQEAVINNITDIINKRISEMKNKIEKEHKENLLYISDYKISNYASFKISFEISYIVSNKSESALLFINQQLNNPVELKIENGKIVIMLGNYPILIEIKKENKGNIGNIKRKFINKKNTTIEAIRYFYNLK